MGFFQKVFLPGTARVAEGTAAARTAALAKRAKETGVVNNTFEAADRNLKVHQAIHAKLQSKIEKMVASGQQVHPKLQAELDRTAANVGAARQHYEKQYDAAQQYHRNMQGQVDAAVDTRKRRLQASEFGANAKRLATIGAGTAVAAVAVPPLLRSQSMNQQQSQSVNVNAYPQQY